MICGSSAADIRDIKRVDFWIKPHFALTTKRTPHLGSAGS
jgi:hypothetical protein